jgi:enoyl-CoA hydratase
MLKPVIACIHGYCIGGGMDLSAACDIRVASDDAKFSVREIKIGLTADIGTLAHIERAMNKSAAREMCFTGGDYTAAQMKEWGYLSRVFENPDVLLAETRKLAESIACNSSLVLSGVKNTLNYARGNCLLKCGYCVILF